MSEVKTYTLTDIVRETGLSYGTIYNHTERGAIPTPSIHVGRRAYYTAAERERIVSYFAGRKVCSRIGVFA